MDPKTILTPILTKESKHNALFDTEGVETVDPYPKQHNTNVPGYDNFSKNNYYPSSMLLPVDTVSKKYYKKMLSLFFSFFLKSIDAEILVTR